MLSTDLTGPDSTAHDVVTAATTRAAVHNRRGDERMLQYLRSGLLGGEMNRKQAEWEARLQINNGIGIRGGGQAESVAEETPTAVAT
tara:strand:- start:282 stop:542 length:261 start_codon:yes stop_codon:yes gene_type:complete